MVWVIWLLFFTYRYLQLLAVRRLECKTVCNYDVLPLYLGVENVLAKRYNTGV